MSHHTAEHLMCVKIPLCPNEMRSDDIEQIQLRKKNFYDIHTVNTWCYLVHNVYFLYKRSNDLEVNNYYYGLQQWPKLIPHSQL